MRNKRLIIFVSFLAVIICLIITLLLFYAVPPESLVILSFTIGVVTGVSILAMVINLRDIIRSKRLKNEE
jgi:hypothetical protein